MGIQPNIEQDKAFQNIKGFFAGLEKRQPDLVEKIVPLLMNLIGGEVDLSPENIWNNRENFDVGLSFLSDWLRENGYQTFSISLNDTESLKKIALSAKLSAEGKKPKTARELYELTKIPKEKYSIVNQEINYFSGCIKNALQFGFRGKRIFGGLLLSGALKTELPNFSKSMNRILERASPGRIMQYGEVAIKLMGFK